MAKSLVKKFKLSLGKAIGGGDLAVVGYTLGRGKPATYIQGGTHGGEITYPIFKRLSDYLRRNKFKGTVTLVPISNPVSWGQRLYFYTAGKFSIYDGKDWNRFFPGKVNGTTAQRISHLLFSKAREHDFVIDLHTSRWSKPFLIISGKRHLKLAGKIGISHTYLTDLGEKGPLSGAIDEVGIEGFTLECGSHDSINYEDVDYCFEVLLNTLSVRGHFEYAPTLKDRGVYYTELKTYTAPSSGFVDYLAGFWQEYKKGDVLYKLYPADSLSRTIEVKAEEDGIMVKHQPSHTVLIGDQIVQTVPRSSIKSLPK